MATHSRHNKYDTCRCRSCRGWRKQGKTKLENALAKIHHRWVRSSNSAMAAEERAKG